MRTLILGNSHTVALAAGFGTGDDFRHVDAVVRLGPGTETRQTFSRPHNGGVILTSRVFRRSLRLATGMRVLRPGVRIGVCMSRRAETIYERDDWLTAWPTGLPDPHAAKHRLIARISASATGRTHLLRPCSEAVLDRIIARHIAPTCEFLGHLHDAGIAVFAVATPPPKRRRLTWRRCVPFAVKRHIQSRTLAAFDGWLGDRGIPLIDWPPETADADGFLRPAFSKRHSASGQRDGYHANDAYGRLMMRRIDDALSRWPAAEKARLTA